MTASSKRRKARKPEAVVLSQYSLWTVPHACWGASPGALPAGLDPELIQAELRRIDRELEARLRSFQTPVSPEALNRNIQ